MTPARPRSKPIWPSTPGYPEQVQGVRDFGEVRRAFVLLAALALSACAGDDGVPDPLDPELIRDISMAQGSASADSYSGPWQLVFEPDSCDCPSVEVDGQAIDLCALAGFAGQGFEVELIHSGGLLAIPSGPESTFGVLTGAIESDGAFSVAALHDTSTIAGPLESLARMDGSFAGDNAEGWAGQRLIGEVAGAQLDCRWIGSFVATRL